MLKVFLVEDEIVMREGMKNNVDWTKEGFEFVGDASDGELAYPMIQKKKPDILITDIKMPFMDGLELSRLVKKELPDTRIILLSGYDEFQYAKEAIEIGITDYLVKPITGAQLVEALKKVEKKIQAESSENGKTKAEQQIANRQKLFRRLVSGRVPFAELVQEGRENGVELIADAYNLILLQFFLEEESDAVFERIPRLIEQIGEEPQLTVFRQGREEAAILLRASETKPMALLQQETKDRITDLLKSETQITFFGAVGNSVARLSDLRKCYEETNLEYSCRYTAERGQFVSARRQQKQEDDFDIENLNVSQLDKRKLEQFLSTGTQDEIAPYIESYFQTLGDRNVRSLLLRQYVIMDFYVVTAGFLEHIGYAGSELPKRCGDVREMAQVLEDTQQTKDYLEKLLATAIELRENAMTHKYEGIVLKAKNYIEENYDKDEISLNMVAAKVNLSPSHFSTIFGQETGETFIEYLTRIRMEKAKQLLRTTNMRTTDIAFAVGYRDAHYFSNLFKKLQGCTPREYRSR